jgi:hypothetical protein
MLYSKTLLLYSTSPNGQVSHYLQLACQKRLLHGDIFVWRWRWSLNLTEEHWTLLQGVLEQDAEKNI